MITLVSGVIMLGFSGTLMIGETGSAAWLLTPASWLIASIGAVLAAWGGFRIFTARRGRH